MKKSIIFFLSYFLLVACEDAVDLSSANQVAALRLENGISQQDIGPVNPYVWTRLQVPQMDNYPYNNPNGNAIIVPVNGEVYCLSGDLYEVGFKLNLTTKRWEPFSDPHDMFLAFAGGFQYLFSYQEKFYYGFQMDNGGEEHVRSLDPVTGARGVVADFPGTPVARPTAFRVGSKGYVIGGSVNDIALNQFWEYDFITNQWTNKGALPGGPRANAVTFVLNNKVYFGMGHDYLNFNGQSIKRYKTDWLEMDPASGGVAAIKAPFPGTKKEYINGFTINDKFYIGTGQSGDDFWEYNPANNKWTQKTDCPATHSGYRNTGVFTLGNVAYFVKGDLAEFWRYSVSSVVPAP
jgi:hypothetical protein